MVHERTRLALGARLEPRTRSFSENFSEPIAGLLCARPKTDVKGYVDSSPGLAVVDGPRWH
jgi:hypothetical protein